MQLFKFFGKECQEMALLGRTKFQKKEINFWKASTDIVAMKDKLGQSGSY